MTDSTALLARELSRLPLEAKRLLNPAFVSSVLRRASLGYAEADGQNLGMPFPLGFLILPLVLHGRTRDEINGHKPAYGLHRLVRADPEVLDGLDRRTEGYRSVTLSGLLFGANHGLLKIDVETLRIVGSPAPHEGPPLARPLAEAMAPVRAAGLLGRWFAAMSVAQVFLTLQLRPGGE